MNKTAIKNFAIWARNKLIADITYKAGLLGVTDKKIESPLPQSTQTVQFFEIGMKEPFSITGAEIEQRKKLVEEIQSKANQSDYKTAYKNVVEEVAYTWFNRLIAVRFMEVNDYLPTHIRVLSSESSDKAEPDLVTHPMDADLNYTPYEKDRIMQQKNDNRLDNLFRMLFIKQCNTLNEILPELFEKTNDYTELLMNVTFTDNDGVVYHLVHDISEDDFKEAVEIIGWMYQYYNDERKNEVINIYKGTVKKEDIPAATQLFTTDWVVRYMVDNSLGRYWIERNPNSPLIEKLEYFVTPKRGEIQTVNEKIEPQDVTFFDPCMGSGHILVYAFDVLMEIYRERGYSDRDAAVSILQNNIFGLDIDDRAYQLAYFAVMMKARSYNRRVLTMKISPNLCAIQESNAVKSFLCDGVTNDRKQNEVGEYLIQQFLHAKEIGSLQTIGKKDYCSFEAYLQECFMTGQVDLFSSIWFSNIVPLMFNLTKQAKILSQKYAVVATNPPYLNKMEGHLKEFVTTKFKQYCGDLFSVFMYRNFDFCLVDGYSAFMAPFVWMFIQTYKQLREYIISQKSITTLVQMEYSAFEEATVPICSFVLKNGNEKEKGLYFKLSEFRGGMAVQKEKYLEALANKDCGYFYETSEDNFSKIPGSPIAYWVKNYNIFGFEKLGKGYVSGGRNKTHNNERYVRRWWEIANLKRWQPYANGGEFRKWYGNHYDVVDWSKDAKNEYASHGGLYNEKFWNKKGICWNLITSYKNGFRIKPSEFHYSSGSPTIISGNDKTDMIKLGFLNTELSAWLIKMFNPTLNTTVNDVLSLPFKCGNEADEIYNIVTSCVEISRKDWDSYETSWDYEKHPLINTNKISKSYAQWKAFSEQQFKQLKANEVQLNRLFNNIFDVQNEQIEEIDDKDITIHQADLGRDIRSLVSYAVGCMFGRYSLDVVGLAYIGNQWDDSKYRLFIPDKHNILPITDEEYFSDDIVGGFADFVKSAYGLETLEENLDFIAKILGNKGDSSREIIRNYFLKDFFKDHCKTYQNRPIYWMFDSGKVDGFKALIYMHRYNADTVGNLRIDYLHRMQRIYENEISRMQEAIDNSKDSREVAAATKRKEKLVKQHKETKEYDEKVAHLALARIDIDLDDGVKTNYEKIQTGTDGKKLDILARI